MERQKFINFVESLKTDSNEKLINTIIEGFEITHSVIMEEQDDGSKKISELIDSKPKKTKLSSYEERKVYGEKAEEIIKREDKKGTSKEDMVRIIQKEVPELTKMHIKLIIDLYYEEPEEPEEPVLGII